MNILIIEDDPQLLALLRRYLRGQNHDTAEAATGYEGLKLLESFSPSAIILDNQLPDVTGLELLPLLRERSPQAAVLMITGLGSAREAVAALKLGADNYLEKPFELEELGTIVEDIAERRRPGEKLHGAAHGKELPPSSKHADYLELPSQAMRELYAHLREAAKAVQVNVLVEGETGTGKEHIARMLHDYSPRAAGPFVELHCAALPESLLESELFGYEAGAFTGAARAKPGLMEMAQGGTLFLDEIGELPMELQAKLLKVLEERQMRRLGSLKPLALDLRLVTASNLDLEGEVKKRRFRPDLFYRLNVLRLKLPPLRGRGEDIEALAGHFAQRFSSDFGKPLRPISEALLLRLKAQPWPGNIRQLRNTMERAVLQAKGLELTLEDLNLKLPDLREENPPMDGSHSDPIILRQVMEDCRWNRSLAAERLGISRPTLLKWLKRHGLLCAIYIL